MFRPAHHPMKGTEGSVVILKSSPFGPSETAAALPYRIDLLTRSNLRPVWTDRHLSGAWSRIAAKTEGWTVPWTQALLTRSERRDAVATIAMFESEGHGLAFFRRLTGRRRPPLIVVACWLADIARRGGVRVRLYRWIYGAIDEVVVFSSNQRTTISELLGIPPDRIRSVRFGVDLEALAAVPTGDCGRLVAAGRDLSRDWPTLFTAVQGTGWQVDLITRERQVRGLRIPEEVTLHGTLDRDRYLAILASAAVVAIPTEVREYPGGQTVLLEAMALGKACVVTDTPAIREYVRDGVDGLLVPPGDPVAARVAIARLMNDPAERGRLGEAARAASDASGGAAAMWGDIAEVVGNVVQRDG